jgi:hypothetical protein
MKWLWIVPVVVCVAASGAMCQDLQLRINVRSWGMGGAATGVADDSGAWLHNPAGLASLTDAPPPEGSAWGHQISGSYADFGSSTDGFAITWSGWQPEKNWGVGVGYWDVNNIGKLKGAGFGMNVGDTGLSVGANFACFNPDFGSGGTSLNLGGLYETPISRRTDLPLRIGLTVTDLTSEFTDPMLNFGLAWPVTDKLLLAGDVLDLFGEVNTLYDIGAEYKLGTMNEFRIRAGLFDTGASHKLSLGGSYQWDNWRVEGAWVNTNPDLWTVGLTFGLDLKY